MVMETITCRGLQSEAKAWVYWCGELCVRVLIPAFKNSANLDTIVSSSGLEGKNAAKKYGFEKRAAVQMLF